MGYDPSTYIKLANLQTQLSGINSDFLSKLNSGDLRSLLDKVTQAETRIRAELQNVRRK